METEKCVNCEISNVPLYLGLDNRKHCADHIGMLLAPTRNTSETQEDHNGQVENAEKSYIK